MEETQHRLEALLLATGIKQSSGEKAVARKAAKLYTSWSKAAKLKKGEPAESLTSKHFVKALFNTAECKGADYEMVRHGMGTGHRIKGAHASREDYDVLLCIFRYLDADEDGRLSCKDLAESLNVLLRVAKQADAAAGGKGRQQGRQLREAFTAARSKESHFDDGVDQGANLGSSALREVAHGT